jgi:hypothetical protein
MLLITIMWCTSMCTVYVWYSMCTEHVHYVYSVMCGTVCVQNMYTMWYVCVNVSGKV